MKKIEAFIRDQAFEPIRIRTGEWRRVVLQADSEDEIAAEAAPPR